MTTTVSFATRDCVVIGCDSLATTTTSMINPFPILKDFFEDNEELTIKTDEEGEPVLKKFGDLGQYIEDVPYNQLPSVTKIFNLEPTNIGVLFAGIAVLNDKSIKNIVDDFLDDDDIKKYLSKSSYTVSGTTERLKKFLEDEYDEQFSDAEFNPSLEIIVSGYSKNHKKPEIYKIQLKGDEKKITPEAKRGDHKVVFGGQYDVIQRVVYGIDLSNFIGFIRRARELIENYNEILEEELNDEDINYNLPEVPETLEKLDITNSSWSSGMSSNWSNFSEQAAIDFVDFLVDIMIKSQQFSNKLPTVGGDIHLAIITKSGGFKWISKEEYKYKDYGISKH